jgi:hydrogenase maturation protein HypF
VQGVGFRPFVFRLAEELGLCGWVLNDEHGVLIEAEGPAEAVATLDGRIRAEAPPLAEVESVTITELTPTGETGFRIVESKGGGERDAAVSPDMATCEDCLAELFDPADRRYRYPFTNCTNCGPRFTIVTGIPYDRPQTTMAGFVMCARCLAEYEDPRDRRFHAQPNACPACGPRAWLADRDGAELDFAPHEDAIAGAAAALLDGAIVAVKGIGGFHLACRADDERAVAALRGRKHREDKPFALMAPTLEAARELVVLTPGEESLLTGRERPIVVARRHESAIADSVAPRSPDLGVMLPYSPLHHLLLADAGVPLVMTSGNVSDEPIAFADDDALARLHEIADLFLLHDRPIRTRTDDSVLRALDPALRPEPLQIRRSRGFVPRTVDLPVGCEAPILACGAEQKNTFCLAKGSRAWVSHHIGDLENYETLASLRDGIEHFGALFEIEPRLVAHDLHPEYLSTKHAMEREGVELVGVQHHHAHLAACLAEHGAADPAVGAIYDGTGYGPDGTIWGGEILVGDLTRFDRAGMLFPVRLPGGAAAVREPWRMACAWLCAALGEERPPIPPTLLDEVSEKEWDTACRLVASGVNSPLTTSAGRLFDAVAALCGVRARVSTEGQAAVELEGIADPSEDGSYEMPLLPPGGTLVIDARPTLRSAREDLSRDVPVALVAARFHNTLATATAQAVAAAAEDAALSTAVLSGGVFQNRLLLERTAELLRDRGLRVLVPVRLPPNDGGISYGQAAVAAARARA